MGSVYRVKRRDGDQISALKIMRRELVNNVAAVRRFEQEVKACMSLSNSNLFSVHGLGHAEDGSPYLVMDYLEGESLQQIWLRMAFLMLIRLYQYSFKFAMD
jgi:eukaryotic-like serine/threonine-protein kinase